MRANDGNGSQPMYTLSRADVAARLKMSVSSVRRLEFDKLHPLQDQHGVWRFDPTEVEAVAAANVRQRRRAPLRARHGREEQLSAAREGRTAATVFRMFARGMTLPQIVVATNQSPVVIRDLYREWSTSLDHGEWERRTANE